MNPSIARGDFLKLFCTGTSFLAVTSPFFGVSACNAEKNNGRTLLCNGCYL